MLARLDYPPTLTRCVDRAIDRRFDETAADCVVDGLAKLSDADLARLAVDRTRLEGLSAECGL
ncbi:MAG: hypothetical protein ACRDLD_06675 [Thermoleophilaceae bacterium]